MKIVFNGEPREVPAALTVSQLLDQFQLTGRPLAVEVNREVVPRNEHARFQLNEGDQVEVVSFVGGG